MKGKGVQGGLREDPRSGVGGFKVMPDREGNAFRNMGEDLLLLEEFPRPESIRFRHYGWIRRAVTFGYSQKIAAVETHLEGREAELCRRPTGGGVVEHGNDWTYSLVIPFHHSLFRNTSEIYRITHEAMRTALRRLGWEVELAALMPAPLREETAGEWNRGNGRNGPAVCFEKAESNDLVNSSTGRKVAGAAMKKNRHGILLEGSLNRSVGEGKTDWGIFKNEFVRALGAVFGAAPEDIPYPRYDASREREIIARFASPAWNRKR